MKIKGNDTFFFFQRETISTIKRPDKSYSIFRKDYIPLAEKDSLSGQTLLASDFNGSVLRADHEHQAKTRRYSPYGHDANSITESVPIGFNGEWLDSLSQTYLLGMGYRSFNPAVMRFYQPDDLSPFGEGGINAYAYCSGDPVNNVDPSGNFSIPHFFRRLFSKSVIKNSKAKITEYWNKIEQEQRSAYDPALDGSNLQHNRLARYATADIKIKKYQRRIKKHTETLKLLEVAPPEASPSSISTNDEYDYYRPIPASPSTSKSPTNLQTKKQKILDASRLDSKEQELYDSRAPVQIKTNFSSSRNLRQLHDRAATVRS